MLPAQHPLPRASDESRRRPDPRALPRECGYGWDPLSVPPSSSVFLKPPPTQCLTASSALGSRHSYKSTFASGSVGSSTCGDSVLVDPHRGNNRAGIDHSVQNRAGRLGARSSCRLFVGAHLSWLVVRLRGPIWAALESALLMKGEVLMLLGLPCGSDLVALMYSSRCESQYVI